MIVFNLTGQTGYRLFLAVARQTRFFLGKMKRIDQPPTHPSLTARWRTVARINKMLLLAKF